MVGLATSACQGGEKPAASPNVSAPSTAMGGGESPATKEKREETKSLDTTKLEAFLEASSFEAAFAWSDTGKGDDGGPVRCIGSRLLCRERFPAASTFKIPHALIGLEVGVLSGPDHPMTWDGKRRFIKSWNRDQTLTSAIRFSAVWYFQRLSLLIGRERMVSGLGDLSFGNQDIGERLDAFWLNGSLRVSAREQVQFWRRLFNRELPVKNAHQATVIDIALQVQDDRGRLFGKTGWFRKDGNKTNIGWFVGCLESKSPVCFAAIISADEPFDSRRFRSERMLLARGALESLGYEIPSTTPSTSRP